MRIISGTYKGKYITGYEIVGTRPTMDRMKESLFAMIGSKIKDTKCLDLFAGSGALGFEALSNGAESCVFVDQNKKAIDALQVNYKNLGITEPVTFLKADFRKALKTLQEQQKKFDLVFLDPPYQDHFLAPAIALLKEYQLLAKGAIIVCESEGEDYSLEEPIWKEKQYGSKQVRMYQMP